MKNTLDKILTVVPFMCCNKKWETRVGEKLSSINFVNSMISPGLIIYLSGVILYSLYSGKPILNDQFHSDRRDYLEQQETSQKQDYRNSLRQEFQRLDTNNDGIIDLTEFIYRN